MTDKLDFTRDQIRNILSDPCADESLADALIAQEAAKVRESWPDERFGKVKPVESRQYYSWQGRRGNISIAEG